MSTNGQILVLLDMNGTICYRTEEPVPGKRPDLYIRHKNYYKRKGIEDFVERLMESNQYQVAVYSSMMIHNIKAGLNALFPARIRNRFAAVLDRDMNSPDPNGAQEWDTVRDVKKVYARMHGFGPHNTILLDNEARKFANDSANGIVVPEHGAQEVRENRAGTLDGLLEYLLQLAAAAPEDVREYMRSHPFDPRRPAEAAAAAAAAAAPPPPAARGPSASMQLHPEDALLNAFSRAFKSLNLGPSDVKKEAGASGVGTSGAGASGAAAASPSKKEASPPAPASTRGGPSSPPAVPPGTALHFVCLEDGQFKMTGKYNAGSTMYAVQVQGDATKPTLRIDPKMDFNRLQEEAAREGVELKVKQEAF